MKFRRYNTNQITILEPPDDFLKPQDSWNCYKVFANNAARLNDKLPFDFFITDEKKLFDAFNVKALGKLLCVKELRYNHDRDSDEFACYQGMKNFYKYNPLHDI